MTDATERLRLPMIAAGQAQKEMAHNEALTLLDLAVQASVEAAGLNHPPDAPQPGACWIVGPAPSGDWQGREGAIAGWTQAGWRFVAPRAGLTAWNRSAGVEMRCDGAAWSRGEVAASALVIGGVQVTGPRQPAITDPAGGQTIDLAARTAIAAMLETLRSHGLIAR